MSGALYGADDQRLTDQPSAAERGVVERLRLLRSMLVATRPAENLGRWDLAAEGDADQTATDLDAAADTITRLTERNRVLEAALAVCQAIVDNAASERTAP